jgi:hypothetical protein
LKFDQPEMGWGWGVRGIQKKKKIQDNLNSLIHDFEKSLHVPKGDQIKENLKKFC